MKVLVVKTSSLGDVIHCFPVIDCLKDHGIETIDWVAEEASAPILEAHPSVNKVVVIDTKRWRKDPCSKQTRKQFKLFRQKLQSSNYDILFDLQGNTKSAIVTFFAKAKRKVGFGWRSAPEFINPLFTQEHIHPSPGKTIREDYLCLVEKTLGKPCEKKERFSQLSISLEEKKYIIEVLSKIPSETPRVMVCPGAAWLNKRLKRRVFLEFLQKVQERISCHYIFVWGSKKERIMVEKIYQELSYCSTIIEKGSLPVLQNLMAVMDRVIAMDSLPLHLAATSGVPTFSVFGPSSAKKYKPLGQQHYAIQGKCPFGKIFDKRCPLLRSCQSGACIHSLTADALYRSYCEKVMDDDKSKRRVSLVSS